MSSTAAQSRPNGDGSTPDLPRVTDPLAEAQREMRGSGDWPLANVCLVILTVLALLYTLAIASDIVLPLLFAAVLNLLLLPARRLLVERLRLPAGLAAVLLLLALAALAIGVLTALSLPAANWISKLPQSLPTLQQKLGFLGPIVARVRHVLEQVQSMVQMPQSGASAPAAVAVREPTSISGVGLTVLQGTQVALGQALVLGVVLLFLLTSGDTLLRRLVEIMPSFSHKRRLIEITVEIERNVSSYLLTITAMNALVGIANGLSMWLQGLPDPLLWGTLAFLLNYVPLLGPVTGIVIFFAVGLVSGDSLWQAALPPAIYFAIHVAEGEAITPMLLARRFTLNPVLVIVSLFFWNWMWGIAGAFLAVPLLAIAKIVCDKIAPLTPLGHLLGASRKSQ